MTCVQSNTPGRALALTAFLPGAGPARPAPGRRGCCRSSRPGRDRLRLRRRVQRRAGPAAHPLRTVAAALGALLTFTLFRDAGAVIGTSSLPVPVDALARCSTADNGGLGVRVRAVQYERYFFPWRPIEVSPSSNSFLSEWGGGHFKRTEVVWCRRLWCTHWDTSRAAVVRLNTRPHPTSSSPTEP